MTSAPVDLVQQFITSFERRQRNLVKRKSKLDAYRDKLTKGETLKDEQRKAVEGYDGVMQSIGILQEVVNQSKELSLDVEKSMGDCEFAKERETEQRMMNFLHIHSCLMRFMNSLDMQDVRLAVSKASSENHLKLLDSVRSIVTAPLIDDWPGTNQASILSTPEFLESHPKLSSTAKCAYDFCMGRSVPIPLDQEVAVKKHSFKDVRALCFRLLATPMIQASLGLPMQSKSSRSMIGGPKLDMDDDQEAAIKAESPLEPACQYKEEQPCICPTEDLANFHTPVISNSIQKPLSGTFNFLQVSKIMSEEYQCELNPEAGGSINQNKVDQPAVSSRSCIDVQPETEFHHQVPMASEVEYTSQPHSMDFTGHNAAIDEGESHNFGEHAYDVENNESGNKPVSYADLVRRQRTGTRIPTVSTNTGEYMQGKLPTPHALEQGEAIQSYSGSSTQPGQQNFREGFARGGIRRGRGQHEFRGRGGGTFNRGIRRGLGSNRGGRYEQSRGGGGPFRGMSTGVPQATY